MDKVIQKAIKREEPPGGILTNQETPAEDDFNNRGDWKVLLIVLSILIGLGVLSFAGVTMYNGITAANVVSVDELHQKNLEGDLNEDEGYVYNGYSFVKADGLWWTEMNKFGTVLKVPLHFGPQEVENITIKGKFNPRFNDDPELYFTIDPLVYDGYYVVALRDIRLNLKQGMDIPTIGACTTMAPGCENRTIVSCENANGRAVIELAIAPEPSIELNDTCIKVSGSGYGIVMAAERLLYIWYGVME